ncbi:MAG: cation diffusion facilitator family transporter [Thiovulaceae bacterium]|nr:cation diffusion facilitator family transporter [Sulfurimonadaceae bacterium]
MKFTAGIISGSVAILASAIDSLLDIAISIFNYFALHTADKEADERFNFGRGKIEAIAAVIEGVIITISGMYILYLSIDKLITNAEPSYIVASVIVMLISTIITGALVLFLIHIAKKSNSIVIKADALHYKTDLFTNGGILLSLGIIALTDWFIIDALVGIGIALYIIYSAYGLIKEGTLMLLDVALEPELVQQIVTIIDAQEDVNSHHWLQTRRSGSDIFVSMHLVFDEDISLLKAHKISDKIDAKIKRIDNHFNWRITIHLDPHDDSGGH